MTQKFRRPLLPAAGLPRSSAVGSKPQIDTGAGAGKTNKFSAKRTELDGISFDSKKEARRWAELTMLEKAGEIRGLERQVRIDLIGQHGPLKTRTGRAMHITVDFAYEDRRQGWAKVFEDSKGIATRDYEVRRAVAEAMGIRIIET